MHRLPDQVFVNALNHLLASAPWARERLAPHAHAHVRIESGPLSVDFTLNEEGYAACLDTRQAEPAPDVTLALAMERLPGLLAEGGLDKASTAVRLQGDASLAETLGFVFRHLRWDAEEDLSRLVGDIAAHRLMRGARAVHQTGLRTLESLSGNLGEYLTEESRLLVPRDEASPLNKQLTDLRDALARLEKRIERLEHPVKRGGGR